MVKKWLAYELLQLELADIPERVRPSLGRIGYSLPRVRRILIFLLLWEDCPLELDAALARRMTWPWWSSGLVRFSIQGRS